MAVFLTGSTSVKPPSLFRQALVFRYTALEPEARRAPQIVGDYTRWFLAGLRAVEARVEANEYLCDNRFTVADISVGYALLLAQRLGQQRFHPATMAYWRPLELRSGYHRARVAKGIPGGEPGPFR